MSNLDVDSIIAQLSKLNERKSSAGAHDQLRVD